MSDCERAFQKCTIVCQKAFVMLQLQLDVGDHYDDHYVNDFVRLGGDFFVGVKRIGNQRLKSVTIISKLSLI